MGKSRFSLPNNRNYYDDDSKPKIDLISCPVNHPHCKNYLSEINQNFLESRRYRTNNEYFKSIERLKIAFENTFEKKNASCFKCAELFRLTITQSLENIYDELRKLSTGLFRTTRYQSSFILAENVLKEFKKQD